MTQLLLDHYKKQYPFERFYDIVLHNILTKPGYIDSKNFLIGYSSNNSIPNVSCILTNHGDTRIDLPVWFGSPDATNRIAVIGLEPRDTDKTGNLNIERSGQNVYATPFALEQSDSRYYKIFKDFLNTEDTLIYFTDVVKTYSVTGDKIYDDHFARRNFWRNAKEQKNFLFEELRIIKPTKIAALGRKAEAFLSKHLEPPYRNLVKYLRHPSYGGALVTRGQIEKLLTE